MILTEEQIKHLKETWVKFPWVKESCIGCSACVAIAWDIFYLNDEWKSVVKALDTYNEDDVNNSISVCPVDSIYWEN